MKPSPQTKARRLTWRAILPFYFGKPIEIGPLVDRDHLTEALGKHGTANKAFLAEPVEREWSVVQALKLMAMCIRENATEIESLKARK